VDQVVKMICKKNTEVKLHFMVNSIATQVLITLSQMCNTGAAFVSF